MSTQTLTLDVAVPGLDKVFIGGRWETPATGRMVDISDGGTSLRVDGNWGVGMQATISIHGVELSGRIVESSNGIVRFSRSAKRPPGATSGPIVPNTDGSSASTSSAFSVELTTNLMPASDT